MNIPTHLVTVLNPEGKQLTMAQWGSAYNKYLANEHRKQELRNAAPGQASGVCVCGSKQFRLKVIVGSGGQILRTCKNDECQEQIIV